MAIDPNAPMPQPNPAPVQPAAGPAPDLDSANAAPTPGVSPAAGVSPNPAPIKPGMQPVADPNAAPGSVEPHHGVLASIFQDLAGGQKTTWRQTPNGPVPVKENLAPGEMARGIVAAALTGLAAGYGTKGGAGRAASAGFSAVTQQTQENQDKAQSQAQEQFKNKQAAQQAADEHTLSMHRDAREQQDSIQRSQMFDINHQEAQKAAARGDWHFAAEQADRLEKQTDRLNILQEGGLKPMTYPNGDPLPTFSNANGDGLHQAQLFANKNAKLVIAGYKSQVEYDPSTNSYTVMQKPADYDKTPLWFGVKMNGDKPALDKDGKMISNGKWRNPMTGEPDVPAGPMTQSQYVDTQLKAAEFKNLELTRLESLEKIRGLKLANSKAAMENKANQEYTDALNAGGIDAVGKDGKPILSAASRIEMARANTTQFNDAAKSFRDLSNDLANWETKNDPGLPANNPQQIAYENEVKQRQAEVDDAQEMWHQLQVKQMILTRDPGTADTIAKNLKAQFGDEADKHVPTGLGASVEQQVRQKLSGTVPNRFDDSAIFNQALGQSQAALKTHGYDQVVAAIKADKTISPADQQKLIDALPKTGPETPQPQQPQVQHPGTLAGVLEAAPVDQSGGAGAGAMQGMTR